jgi:signal peptidase
MSTDVLIDPPASAYARAGEHAHEGAGEHAHGPAGTGEPAVAPVAARKRSAIRRAAGFIASVAAGLAVGLLLATGISLAMGYRTFSVLSGSMEPTIHTGDAVVDEPIPPLDARVGDVITFKDPSRGGELVTHRVRSVRPSGAMVAMVTKGDANTAVERWNVPTGGSLGRVAYRLPDAGRVIAAIRGRYGRLLLIALPALFLGLYELSRIWRPRGKR